MQKKFTVLRVVGTIYKVLAWVVLVFGLLGSCGMIAVGAMPGILGAGSGGRGTDALGLGAMGMVGGVIGGLGLLLYVAFIFLFLYAFGEVIYLLVSLEENTRLTAERLLAQPLPPTTADTTLSTTKM